jgi:cob(I)alamin adenosyltransferase
MLDLNIMSKPSTARIVTSYKEGKGDNSCTKNINSKTLLDQSLEYLRNDISLCLKDYKYKSLYRYKDLIEKIGIYIYSEEVYKSLFWLRENSFNISAFILCKGNSDRHRLQEESLRNVETLLYKLKSEIGDCQDFLMFNSERLSRLDRVRISLRTVELYLNECLSIESIEDKTLKSLINRISTLFFWLLRKENTKKEIHWKGYTTLLKF